ncbi:MAG TPA: polyisoprenoid-binding protein [Chromatiales bacterium]|nr:polyisoprenoid-binding protein [Chromatiales bacterium]
MTRRWLYSLALSLVLFLLGSAGAASTGEVCSAFRGGKVEPEIITQMLEAASQGHLYRVQQGFSRVEFCVRHALAGRIHGEFQDFEGGVSLSPDDSIHNRALLLVRANSIKTGNAAIEALAKDDLFFDAERYPEILFVSRRFEILDSGKARLYGDLTLHGVTRPVAFEVELDPDAPGRGDADRLALHARTTVRRSEFGMTHFKHLVSDEVTLCLKFVVERIPPRMMASG